MRFLILLDKNLKNIDSQELLKEKLKVLENLDDIIIANELMTDQKVGRINVNPMDVNYKNLKTRITPVEAYSHEYDMLRTYLKNTHSKMHSHFESELVEIYEVEREGETAKFQQFCDSLCSDKYLNDKYQHHRLLWHGSRICNFVGILSEGLRIAPPQAPATGYFLGKGVYFADISSKSIEYCHPTKENPYVLLLLCEVALGRPFQVAHTKYVTKEDLDLAGYHSVKGCGEFAPDNAYDLVMSNANDGMSNYKVILSNGKEVPSGIAYSELKHNEYVVYDVSQIKARYLVLVKVNSDKEVKALSLLNAN